MMEQSCGRWWKPCRNASTTSNNQSACQRSSGMRPPAATMASRRSKALIAPKPFRQGQVADQSKTDSGNRRPQYPTGESLQRQPEQNQRKGWSEFNNHGAESHDEDTQRQDRPFRARSIQQLAPRHLTEQTGERTCAENEADLLLRPFLIGQIDGHVGTEAR